MNPHFSHDQLIDYVHGELSPSDDAVLQQHLGDCAACRALYQEEVRISESLRSYARATEREMPAGIRNALFDAIERPAPSWQERLVVWLRPAITVPVACALIIAGIAGYETTRPPGTTIDAVYYLDDHAALTSSVPFSEGNPVPAALLSSESVDETE